MKKVDVLCCGLLVADFSFSLPEFPKIDEKVNAESFNLTSGGPAANAALTVRLLGGSSEVLATTDNSNLGKLLENQLLEDGFETSFIIRHEKGLNTAAVLSHQNGTRQVISCKAIYHPVELPEIVENVSPKILLFDGHQPELSQKLLNKFPDCPSILDAGSVHQGTKLLMGQVDWLICSAKFARSYTGTQPLNKAAESLSKINQKVIVTDGQRGCFWNIDGVVGQTPTPLVEAIDSNGAGDVFHGAFAYGLTQDINVEKNIAFASKIAATSCTQKGIRKITK